VPVILTINFNGNQAAIDDPGIKLPVLWDRRTGKSRPATATSRGTDADWQAEQVLNRAASSMVSASGRCFSRQVRRSRRRTIGAPSARGLTG